MKIEFTKEEMNYIMEDSYTFRQKIIQLLTKDTLEKYRNEIRKRFPLFYSSQKIPAIVWIREELLNKFEELSEFESINCKVYNGDWKRNATLGIAAAKYFVESC